MFLRTKGVFKMKKFISAVVSLIVALSTCTALAADKVHLSEKLIVNEDFEDGITFRTPGSYKDQKKDTWEMLSATDNVTVSDGTATITGSTTTTPGMSYFYETQKDETIITFKAKKTDEEAAKEYLRLQLYYNKPTRYRAFIYFTAPQTWTEYKLHITQGALVKLYSKAEGESSFTFKSNWASSVRGDNEHNWDMIKFFVEKTDATFMIDDLKIVSYNPKNDGIYFNEDFEGVTDLSSRGFETTDGISIDTFDNNTAVKITAAASGSPEFRSGTTVDNYQVSSSLPEEYYLSMRIKNIDLNNRLWLQFYHNGTSSSITGSAHDTGMKRVMCCMTAGNIISYDAVTNKYPVVSSSSSGLTANEWVNLVFHIKGDTYRVYVKEQNADSYTCYNETWLTSQATNQTNSPNYIKIYEDSASGSALIDDIRIFTPGMHTYDMLNNEGVITQGVINGTITDTQAVGIVASYDDSKLLKGACVSDNAVKVPAFDAATIIVTASDAFVSGATQAKLYLWDSLVNMIPLITPIDISNQINCLEL